MNGAVLMYIHIVSQNDTIWSISRRYGVSAERIVIDNGLEDLSYLVVGQALLILVPETVHRVQRGESIYTIAQRYAVTEIELLQKNPNLINAPVLREGEEVVISYRDEGDRNIYIYGYVYPYVRQNVLKSALPYVTSCAIFSYGFREDGSLFPIDDEPIIDLCYRYKTAPMMLISSIAEDGNFTSGLATRMFNDITLQNKVISNMIATMKRLGYLGADVDFEYVDPSDKDAYVRFVQNISRRMHENGFTVNVDLAPKTSATQPGTLYEGHDYAALGRAADTVLLMTYEWGYTYGPPMAVAPINQVRRVVEYALTEIDNRKIYMGIPNYGYDWPLPFEKGKTRARGIGNETAVRIASENGAEILFDETAQTPYFEYTQGGTKHVVWFEDIRSIQAKFALIDEFNLRGGGYWNLMNPFTQNFMYVGTQYDIMKIV